MNFKSFSVCVALSNICIITCLVAIFQKNFPIGRVFCRRFWIRYMDSETKSRIKFETESSKKRFWAYIFVEIIVRLSDAVDCNINLYLFSLQHSFLMGVLEENRLNVPFCDDIGCFLYFVEYALVVWKLVFLACVFSSRKKSGLIFTGYGLHLWYANYQPLFSCHNIFNLKKAISRLNSWKWIDSRKLA